VPALAALMFVGHAWEDAGAIAALPYLAIIALSVGYIIRPMVVLWVPLIGAFAWYSAEVALTPSSGPAGEWVFFQCLGLVPVALLWLARPRREHGEPVRAGA